MEEDKMGGRLPQLSVVELLRAWETGIKAGDEGLEGGEVHRKGLNK
jgi:hypothetical protein